ncbi:L-type lectin-domain containing receptor kinase IX.1-like [Vigna unguiculata]|uniref:non-specific serine/threonine protein kinase n=1 Tax=Vigna unguiculata TaxID=3917 RepID=A0A4D6MGT3_VIGUN|nr:L-type lectin-domain containing receptor kinase IX.1-like [Vigna unguiculata]QCD99196.1 interleukin-1 receptor-associated kinase 4 [Vigna unguiculata]
MLATFDTFHYLKTFLLFLILCILPINLAQPLSFTITNFNDTKNASIVGYAGVAKVEDGSVVLNPIIENGDGRVIYGQPLRLKNSSDGLVTDFSTRFSFTIDATVAKYGDGFAFFLAPLAYQIPTATSDGSLLGLYDATQSNIIAVEFDTYINELDPPVQHVGINNNSVVSLNYTKFDIENNLGKMGHALITYDASAQLLAVSWSFDGTSSSSTPTGYLSYKIDLWPILPEWVNVGFSGSTGSSTEKNVIYTWEFSSNLDLNSTHGVDSGIATKCKVQVKIIVITVICSIVFVLVVISISWLIIKKRRTEDGFGLDREVMPRRFGYEEIVAATNGFADDRRLGEGGSGQVYKGFLGDSGRVVAVKRIFSDVEDSERIFRNEVKIISRLIHRNLVQFMGWCHEKEELLLVFEYMSNGSLDNHLFGNRRSLTWDVRYKIVLGVARALRYLHEDAEQSVVHRDIKSANVLLDTDFNTKISDFGIARLVDPRLRTQRTQVVGTYGYLAPEYIKEGRVSKESDMYSFGVLALEIACGRRTYQDGEDNHVPLTKWVWKHYVDGNILNAADEELKMDFDIYEMKCLLTVGIWCTLQDHKERPTSEQVINVLKQEVPLPMFSAKFSDNGQPDPFESSSRKT